MHVYISTLGAAAAALIQGSHRRAEQQDPNPGFSATKVAVHRQGRCHARRPAESLWLVGWTEGSRHRGQIIEIAFWGSRFRFRREQPAVVGSEIKLMVLTNWFGQASAGAQQKVSKIWQRSSGCCLSCCPANSGGFVVVFTAWDDEVLFCLILAIISMAHRLWSLWVSTREVSLDKFCATKRHKLSGMACGALHRPVWFGSFYWGVHLRMTSKGRKTFVDNLRLQSASSAHKVKFVCIFSWAESRFSVVQIYINQFSVASLHFNPTFFVCG